MKKILSLDISSNTIGYALFEYDDASCNLIKYGNIKPPKSNKGNLSFRALAASKDLRVLLKSEKPDEVAVEAYASRFNKGRSTIRTIIVLSFFNEQLQLTTLDELNITCDSYPVMTIRSTISNHLNKHIVSKEEMFDAMCVNFKSFTPRKNRSGNIADESMDETDAIAVGFCHYLIKQKSVAAKTTTKPVKSKANPAIKQRSKKKEAKQNGVSE